MKQRMNTTKSRELGEQSAKRADPVAAPVVEDGRSAHRVEPSALGRTVHLEDSPRGPNDVAFPEARTLVEVCDDPADEIVSHCLV